VRKWEEASFGMGVLRPGRKEGICRDGGWEGAFAFCKGRGEKNGLTKKTEGMSGSLEKGERVAEALSTLREGRTRRRRGKKPRRNLYHS